MHCKRSAAKSGVAALLIGEAFEAATLAFLFSLAELLEQAAARGPGAGGRLRWSEEASFT